MVASSVSTYLDVTQASEAAPASVPAPTETDPTAIEHAAKVLAAVHAGTELVTELPEKTGLDTSQILALLSGLASAGLVVLDQRDDGILRVRLAEPTRVALSST